MAATSKAIGATLFGGYIVDWIGYYNTCLVYACLLLVTGTWQVLFLRSQGLIKGRVYYASKTEINDDFKLESLETGKPKNEGETFGNEKEVDISLRSQLLQSISRSFDAKNL